MTTAKRAVTRKQKRPRVNGRGGQVKAASVGPEDTGDAASNDADRPRTLTLPPPIDANDRLVRKDYILAHIAISTTGLSDLIGAGKFPPPFYLTDRIAVWRQSQVDAIIRNGGRYDPPPSSE